MLKPLTVWIHRLWKILKEMEYQTTLPASWETCMQVKKQQSEPNMEQQNGFKLGKEYVKAAYCHPAYLTQVQSCCLVIKSCPTLLRPHGLYPTWVFCPWDFPGKNTGVSCHFLLRGSSWPRIEHESPALAGEFFTTEPPGKHMQSISCEMPDWTNLKLVSRILRGISTTSDMQMIPL